MTKTPEKSSLLQACVGKGQNLIDLIDYAADSVVSKTIMDKTTGTITLFAFDKGQKLSEHTSPYDAVVQVLDGTARLTIGGQDKQVSAGQIIIMPANVPHAVTADRKFKMLLTMIRTKEQA
jgi:quercetin dioxygenase-like cupin family protein